MGSSFLGILGRKQHVTEGAEQGPRPRCSVLWLLLASPGLSGVHLGAWRAVIRQDISKKEKCFLSSLARFFSFSFFFF